MICLTIGGSVVSSQTLDNSRFLGTLRQTRLLNDTRSADLIQLVCSNADGAAATTSSAHFRPARFIQLLLVVVIVSTFLHRDPITVQ